MSLKSGTNFIAEDQINEDSCGFGKVFHDGAKHKKSRNIFQAQGKFQYLNSVEVVVYTLFLWQPTEMLISYILISLSLGYPHNYAMYGNSFS